MSNLITWKMADEDEGVAFVPYDVLKWILDGLYYALDGITDGFVAMGYSNLHLTLPSGVAIKIWDGDEILDFRLPIKRFKALRFHFGHASFDVPLPDVNINADLLLAWLYKATNIPGSDEWYFKDTDGEIKQGKDMEPVRFYNIIKDGFQDVWPIILIIAIVYVLTRLKLYSAIGRLFSWYWNWQHKRLTKQIDENISELVSDLDNHHIAISEYEDISSIDLGRIVDQISSNSELLRSLSSRIGVRLSL